jgi:hypothetical protein
LPSSFTEATLKLQNLLAKFLAVGSDFLVNRRFFTWVMLIFLLGLSIMSSYFFSQQDARSAINVPLIQTVQSAEALLAAGASTEQIIAGREIDLSSNQNPFITLYSTNKSVIGSSAHMSGKILLIPNGILDRARREGEVRVTWQPTRHLRFASVTQYLPNYGYVSVAESLKEVENEATRNLWRALALWIFGAVTLGAGMILIPRVTRRG